ncbi:four-carbon acid sugar kinase family protein [Paraglaciecola aquimarina]|uniref:3-oxo-tetronate kinase n=1 Tax=Paraglaciecola algarum TaxID=3050085 RepID=A0ABS9DAZ3_9ALTE|nr:3-oxo-tetronate kinase [Paraglaciecola sp. G1-23]MCF2950133.1 four-carbon acid sugar kinase family protein [Paraglaciecola sp. G1-23]
MNNKVVLGPWLGCIADDYTGATDLASFLVASGLKTIQLNEVPHTNEIFDLSPYDAVVIALKSRTCPVNEAICDSLLSTEYLIEQGCQKFFFKYCSTFDSTEQGNIGPVIDALMDKLNVESTIVCPALPVNGRTVYKGDLYVNGQPLHESPMKDHPLTPMKDSNLKRLIEAQGDGKAEIINVATIDSGETAIVEALEKASQQSKYIILDTLNTEHLVNISHSVQAFKFITGGSGLATDLAEEFKRLGGVLKPQKQQSEQSHSPVLIFSGSCSAMTQQQVTEYKTDHPALQLNPIQIANGEQSLDSISQWMLENISASPLIYASANAEAVNLVHQTLGKNEAAELVENTFCQLAKIAKQHKVRNFIVAGGETSGAVVKALDIQGFEIGQSIVPSVPIVTTLGAIPINLALKSGNFGQQDFFVKAKRKLTCS